MRKYRRDVQEVAQVLAHGVGRALIPTRALRGLLGGENFHKALGKVVKFVTGGDVPVQGLGVKLC